MSAPTTSIDSTTGSVVISWITPSSNNGAAVTAYLIQILDSTLTTLNTELTYCDGSSSTVIANM
jgi:hypothetical protein